MTLAYIAAGYLVVSVCVTALLCRLLAMAGRYE